jgi:hypothetical protein
MAEIVGKEYYTVLLPVVGNVYHRAPPVSSLFDRDGNSSMSRLFGMVDK